MICLTSVVFMLWMIIQGEDLKWQSQLTEVVQATWIGAAATV